jgi:hypothetical protein
MRASARTGGTMKRTALMAIVSFAMMPVVAMADEDPELRFPPWALSGELTGKYVNVSGSSTKFLEDYNVQNGVDGRFSVARDLPGDRTLQIDGLGQSGEGQGYLIARYHHLQRYTLVMDVSSSQRFYNVRNGDAPVRDVSPFTNDSRAYFGDDDPAIHRINTGLAVDFQPTALLHDVYLDFHYRTIFGQETLLKDGSVAAPDAIAPGSGPGTVAFDFPSRKNVNYQTYSAFTGTRAAAAGINWQTDLSYDHSDIQSKVIEPNFGTATRPEVDRFLEDNDIDSVKYDLAGSRFLRPDTYVYSGYLFSYDHNQPSPSQNVSPTTGDAALTSRDTQNGGVHRVANALGLGVLFRPHPTLVVTADTRANGGVQSGDVTESRDEFKLFTGDIGTIRNESDRSSADTKTQVAMDWTGLPGTLVHGYARYQYRWLATDSKRNFDVVQLADREREDYTNRYNRFEAGPSLRWSAGHGRAIEVGYNYFYEDVGVSVDQLTNGFIQDDYSRSRHRPYLKGSARLAKNLRSELRFEYVNEHRDLDAPLVAPVIFTDARSGKTTWEAFSVIPSISYQPDPHWNLYSSVSVGQQKLSVDDLGTRPANFGDFRDFEYDALTEMFALTVNYSPTAAWAFGIAYTLVNSDRSVSNQINRVEVTGRYQLNKQWSMNAGYRYLRFDTASNSVDEYAASVPFLGITGRF